MKSIFKSKSFWLNVVGVATLAVPGLQVNPLTIGYIMAGLNIANRFLTKGPVSLLGATS